MDKHMIDIFCKQIETELDRLSKLPQLNDATLNNLQKLTDTKKNLLKIEVLEMEKESMMGGNSLRGRGYSNMGSSYDMGGYSNMPYYGNYAPGQSGMSTGYSGTDSRSHLEAAMRDARNEQEREEIRQIMARYHN